MYDYKKHLFIPRVLLVLTLLCTFLYSNGLAQFTSDIIYKEDGRLTYVADEEGNYIPDFSHAGYRGGGVPLPNVPVKITLDPEDGDDTVRLQQALDDVGEMEKDENGFRGAVKLNPGEYHISNRLAGNIQIRNSGVVLRGSGDGSDPETNTIIHASKEMSGRVLQVGKGNLDLWQRSSSEPLTIITTEFVPVGSRTFEVQDASDFEVGDNIIIRHNPTSAWLEAVDYGATDTEPPWTPVRELDILYNRNITAISGNTIQIDVPVYNHLERSLSLSVMFRFDRSNIITESGVEDLRLVIETESPTSETHADHAFYFDGVENGWARGVTVMHFSYTGIGTTNATFITVKDSRALEPHSEIRAPRRYNFNVRHRSNNILFDNVESSESRHDFIVDGTASASGVVFTNSKGVNSRGPTEGHRLWSTGILFDKLTFENTITNFVILGHYNRGSGGSGHGWASAHSVAWNIDAPRARIFIEKPPTAQNYGIGIRGDVRDTGPYNHPTGYIEGTGKFPEFESLYETQLAERLEYGVPPDPPARLTAYPHEDEEYMELQWSHSSVTNSEIVIERSDDNGLSFDQIAVLDPGETMYADENISVHQYVYRARAVDEAGKSAWSNPAPFNLGITDFQQSSPFSGASHTLSDDDSRTVNFRWSEATSSYDLAYKWFLYPEDGDYTNAYVTIDLNSTSLTFTHKELDDKLEEAGINSGETVDMHWAVKAYTEKREKWADNPHDITLTRSGTYTGINDETAMPQEFKLKQNHPNPFNPSTSIEYALKESGHATLSVYDIMGRKVATLVNETVEAGYHQVLFDASRLSSGTYIYRLEVGDFAETKQMILIK